MTLLSIAITIIVIGFLLWVANTYIPMADNIKQLLNVTVLIILVLWLLNIFLGLPSAGSVHLPTVR